jgi:ketosteroid isomerase-like protein
MKLFNFRNSKLVMVSLLAGSVLLPSVFNFSSSQIQAAEQLTSSGSGAAAEQSADEKAVREQADRFAKAFSSAQAEPIAAMCSQDCTLTDSDGVKYVGRDEILKLYQRTFQEDGANPAYVHIDSLTFPAPGVCIEDGTFFISRVNSETRYSVVHLKRDGAWQMFRINESEYNPEPAETLKELSWMVGNWTLKHHDKPVSLVVHPIAHGNFLAMQFSDKPEQAFDCDQLQLIGWSFKTKDIVSWHYSDDGSFGFGHWLRNGSNWMVDTKGVRRDGSVTTAKYKIDKIDNDHFRWQAVSRESGGEKLPDMPPVDVIRNK